MTVRELWDTAPQAHIMVRHKDNRVEEYLGSGKTGGKKVTHILPTEYPMYKHVLEITIS